jgi:hypothetical protein
LVELLEDIESDDQLPLAGGQQQPVASDSQASADGYETQSEGEIDAEDLVKTSKRRTKKKAKETSKKTPAPRRKKKKTAAAVAAAGGSGGAGDGADNAAEEEDEDAAPRPIKKIKPFTTEEVSIIFSLQ